MKSNSERQKEYKKRQREQGKTKLDMFVSWEEKEALTMGLKLLEKEILLPGNTILFAYDSKQQKEIKEFLSSWIQKYEAKKVPEKSKKLPGNKIVKKPKPVNSEGIAGTERNLDLPIELPGNPESVPDLSLISSPVLLPGDKPKRKVSSKVTG